MYEWKMIEPRTDPYIHNQLIFNKGEKAAQWGMDSLFNNWISTCNKITLNPYITPYIKISTKLIIGLNVKSKTIKLPKKTWEKISYGFGLGKDF